MQNFQVLESPENHSGLSRVLVDGVATQEQCDTMLELAKVRANKVTTVARDLKWNNALPLFSPVIQLLIGL